MAIPQLKPFLEGELLVLLLSALVVKHEHSIILGERGGQSEIQQSLGAALCSTFLRSLHDYSANAK